MQLWSITSIVALLSITVDAHFQLKSPPARGFDEDTLGEYPCGGSNSQTTRTEFPLNGGPVQLDMGHDHAMVQVNLAIGNTAVDGNAFTINLEPVVKQEGLGSFCLGDVVIPSSLGIKDGDNGTIQVVTNGDPSGGLYNCADVTFTANAQPGECTNGTKVTAEAYTGPLKNANGTDASTSTSSTSSASPSATKASGSNALAAAHGMLGVSVVAMMVCVLL